MDAWLKALSTGKNQGCGHVRLMIDQVRMTGVWHDAVSAACHHCVVGLWAMHGAVFLQHVS